MQITILGFDHLVDFCFARLLCLKLEGPVAMVCGLHLDFISDNLSHKFIRRHRHILSGHSGSGESSQKAKQNNGEHASSGCHAHLTSSRRDTIAGFWGQMRPSHTGSFPWERNADDVGGLSDHVSMHSQHPGCPLRFALVLL